MSKLDQIHRTDFSLVANQAPNPNAPFARHLKRQIKVSHLAILRLHGLWDIHAQS
jgi:desulfoferrodoxin (superoxide reductase-like protein)